MIGTRCIISSISAQFCRSKIIGGACSQSYTVVTALVTLITPSASRFAQKPSPVPVVGNQRNGPGIVQPSELGTRHLARVRERWCNLRPLRVRACQSWTGCTRFRGFTPRILPVRNQQNPDCRMLDSAVSRTCNRRNRAKNTGFRPIRGCLRFAGPRTARRKCWCSNSQFISGWTMRSALRQLGQSLESQTQKTRSRLRNCGCLDLCLRIASC